MVASSATRKGTIAGAAPRKQASSLNGLQPVSKTGAHPKALVHGAPQPVKSAGDKPKRATATGKAQPLLIPYCSYGLIKGTLVDDTLRAFQGWDLAKSKRSNLAQIRTSNSIGAASQAWLKQVCATISRRFDPSGWDRSLVLAAQSKTGQRCWRPLLLWHMANNESLLGDGLSWIWSCHANAHETLQTAQALEWLEQAPQRNHAEVADWSLSTRKRVAGGLLKAAVDFDLLQGKVRRRYTAYYLPDEALLYVLCDLLASNRTTAGALADRRWQWFRLSEEQLEHRLLELHQRKMISYFRAGSVVELKLPAPSPEQLVREAWG
jgi:hypothetical protein